MRDIAEAVNNLNMNTDCTDCYGYGYDISFCPGSNISEAVGEAAGKYCEEEGYNTTVYHNPTNGYYLYNFDSYVDFDIYLDWAVGDGYNDYLIGWVPTAGQYYPPSYADMYWQYYDEVAGSWSPTDCVNVTEVLYQNLKDLSFNSQPGQNEISYPYP